MIHNYTIDGALRQTAALIVRLRLLADSEGSLSWVKERFAYHLAAEMQQAALLSGIDAKAQARILGLTPRARSSKLNERNNRRDIRVLRDAAADILSGAPRRSMRRQKLRTAIAGVAVDTLGYGKDRAFRVAEGTIDHLLLTATALDRDGIVELGVNDHVDRIADLVHLAIREDPGATVGQLAELWGYETSVVDAAVELLVDRGEIKRTLGEEAGKQVWGHSHVVLAADPKDNHEVAILDFLDAVSVAVTKKLDWVLAGRRGEQYDEDVPRPGFGTVTFDCGINWKIVDAVRADVRTTAASLGEKRKALEAYGVFEDATHQLVTFLGYVIRPRRSHNGA